MVTDKHTHKATTITLAHAPRVNNNSNTNNSSRLLCAYFPLQVYPRLFRNFHRQVFCWLDAWYDMSMDDIRKMEEETKAQLEQVCPYNNDKP